VNSLNRRGMKKMEKINLGLRHVGIFVKNLEISKKFYCEKLDFELLHENILKEDAGVIKIAFIKASDCILELVQFPVFKERTDGIVDHVAFKVKDIEQTVNILKKRGIEFETEDIVFAKDFFNKGDKWITFKGPDGEHLEINEIL
jgi:lactoylglutathione lyase